MVEDHQMTALQRIAEFSARVRGHQPNGWWTLEGSATSRCATCERSVGVYRSLAQPEMDGAALFPEGRKDLANHQSSKG
jgi:hypothetical protein